jgi:hypothetical protein
MSIKKCKDCGYQLGKDRKTKKWWCSKCKETKDDYDERYRIVVMGKNTGKIIGENNFIKCIAREWRKMGHEVLEIHPDFLLQCVKPYEMEECFRFKKKINLRLLEYRYSPDFIYIEQMYNRYDVSEIKCPVIYQHREYTHFPDIDNPDILFGSYPFRIQFFEQYNPWNYSKIKYRDDNFVAVDPELFPPVKKKEIGWISYMGWSIEPERIADANGIIARMVIEDQVAFREECRKRGLITYIEGGQGPEHYKDMMGKCETILYDGGFINGFGRTLFEAIAMKTLCIIRVHHKKEMDYYKKMGLTDDMCYFIYEPEDIEKIIEEWVSDKNIAEVTRLAKVNRAYKWLMKNHTYEVRARETLEKFEAFQRGETKKPYFMGYSERVSFGMGDGIVTVESV